MICPISGKHFEISDQEKKAYARFGVEPPNVHPDVRLLIKMTHSNSWTLFNAKEARTGKSILSTYNPEDHKEIVDHTYWLSGEFDARHYGREVDFSRPFFPQLAELMVDVPKPNISIMKCEDMEYCNFSYNSKRCYLAFNILHSENILYSTRVFSCKDCIEMFNSRGCELCYDCTNCADCYSTLFANFCTKCISSRFMFDCENCIDCYQCVNLKHKQYCIQNKQYTKEEYFAITEKINLRSHKIFEQEKVKWNEFLKTQPIKAERVVNSENSDGTMINNCQDCHYCFSLANSQNCFSCYGEGGSDGCDAALYGGSTNIVNSAGALSSQNIFCSFIAENSFDLSYCFVVIQAHDCFGCFGIKNGSYCILNKQYSKEEYFVLKEKIIEHMKKTGEFGNFLSPQFSSYNFDESSGAVLFPGEEDWAHALGSKMKPVERNVAIGESVSMLPGNPQDFVDFDKIFLCKETGRPFKIIKQEVEFYKKVGVPLPDISWKTRLERGNRASFILPKAEQCNRCSKTFFSFVKKENINGRELLCAKCFNKEIL